MVDISFEFNIIFLICLYIYCYYLLVSVRFYYWGYVYCIWLLIYFGNLSCIIIILINDL